MIAWKTYDFFIFQHCAGNARIPIVPIGLSYSAPSVRTVFVCSQFLLGVGVVVYVLY